MLQNPQLHYLDNAATTIVAPEVADVIDKAMREHWANPSSLYGPSARGEEALTAAPCAVARTLGCKVGAVFDLLRQRGNNLALLGVVRRPALSAKGIVVSPSSTPASAPAGAAGGLQHQQGSPLNIQPAASPGSAAWT